MTGVAADEGMFGMVVVEDAAFDGVVDVAFPDEDCSPASPVEFFENRRFRCGAGLVDEVDSSAIRREQ